MLFIAHVEQLDLDFLGCGSGRDIAGLTIAMHWDGGRVVWRENGSRVGICIFYSGVREMNARACSVNGLTGQDTLLVWSKGQCAAWTIVKQMTKKYRKKVLFCAKKSFACHSIRVI